MVKYVEHDKASKARRKELRVIGTLPKGKAKQFIAKYNGYGVSVYGTYLDGMVDIGITVYRSLGNRRADIVARWYQLWENRVKEMA